MGDHLNASGFDAYEGIRIVIPGAFALALYAAITATFGLDAPETLDNALFGVVLSLAIGLLLYFIDLPGRAQIYLAAQPHKDLESWGVTAPSGMRMQNVYFVILDSVMPPGIRNRTLYFGSMFRIGFEVIYLAAASALAVLVLAVVTVSPDASRGTDTTVLWLATPLHIVAAVLGFWEGFQMSGREVGSLVKRFRAQIGYVGLLALTLALVATAVYVWWSDWPGFAAAAVALPGILWAWRYLNGYRLGGRRRNIDPPAAAFLLTTAVVTATILAATEAPAQSVLGTAAALGWSGVALTAELLLARRGHERRLWAAYHTQKAWFELNREKLKGAGFVPALPEGSTPAADGQ